MRLDFQRLFCSETRSIFLCTIFCVSTDWSRFLSANLKEFRTYIMENAEIQKEIQELRAQVEQFARGFPMPGYDNH